MPTFCRSLVSSALFCCVVSVANAQFTQQGPKLVGQGSIGVSQQGSAVALSADGNTALVSGPYDNGNLGAVWVFTRANGVWAQQGEKLIGAGAIGSANQGMSVALSSDGNTAIVGGTQDNGGVGAAWVFVRSGGVWRPQGTKLVGPSPYAIQNQGAAVALSADGDTALVGAPSGGPGNSERGVGVHPNRRKLGAAGASLAEPGLGRDHGCPRGYCGRWQYGPHLWLSAGRLRRHRLGLHSFQRRMDGAKQARRIRCCRSVHELYFRDNSGYIGRRQHRHLGMGRSATSVTRGAAWVFTRSNDVWTQQGPKLNRHVGAIPELRPSGGTPRVGQWLSPETAVPL